MKLPVPPRWVRRIVLWPIPVILVWLYLLMVPLLLIIAAVLSYRLPGKLRLVRSIGLLTVYVATEAMVVVAGFALWIGFGFGWKLRGERSIAVHYRLLAFALRILVSMGRRLFVLEIDERTIRSTGGDVDAWPEGPLVVMSRHAGPADSFLLLHEVMSSHGRRPRIVANAVLQLDPAFDILLNRLPNEFISNAPGQSEAAIAGIERLAGGMVDGDALVIFPEGGNFTETRRIRAIDRLRRDGYEAAADRAAQLRNVLPPRPAGARAALGAAPDAGVVFVAHTGLDDIATVDDLWFAIPDHNTLYVQSYVVPAEIVPAAQEERDEMLYSAWQGIDEWIVAVRAESG